MTKLFDCSIWSSLIWKHTACYRVFQNTRAEGKLDVFYCLELMAMSGIQASKKGKPGSAMLPGGSPLKWMMPMHRHDNQ